MNPIRVIIVDDSAVVRRSLKQIIDAEPDMEVVGTAPDPYQARDKLVKLKPDVITLDIEMPKMDGITFLGKLMHYMPIPTIIVSSVTKRGCEVSLHALELGAVEVVPKPSEAYSIESIETVLIQAIRSASRATVRKIARSKALPREIIQIRTTNKILAIGASTGGTEALKEVLTRLPANCPGTVVVQHMPPGFTTAFSQRLNELCAMEVKEAENGDLVQNGICLIAPGDYHMLLKRVGAKYFVQIKKGPRIWHQRPAVDILFKTVASSAGRNAVGVILTGMGKDGAAGMELMKKSGAINIAQSEKTCVVFGMPKVAIESGVVNHIEDIDKIPRKILEILEKA
ncbi:MAG: chemotaxis response regulator protein-glutamate methylesterase [Candidatus Cloacimonetes bacterium]|nr:chemotaxis response regulator protein-glutamate methylesterase [Candidatus Cloacimonadota bacterium]